jgi:hypothetical protein
MFDFTCDTCHQRRLLFPGQVQHVINDEHGITVIVRCWCGELGAIRTGARHKVARRPELDLAS